MSEVLTSFLNFVNFDVVERNVNGIVFSSLLHHLLSNPSLSQTGYVDLKTRMLMAMDYLQLIISIFK